MTAMSTYTDFQEVRFLERRESRIWRDTDAFNFVPAARWAGWRGRAHAWLQRQAWAFLDKSKALTPYRTQNIEVTRHIIDKETFFAAFVAQRKALLSEFNGIPRTMLMGRQDYMELMCATLPEDARFAFEVRSWMMVGEERNPWGRRPQAVQLTMHVQVIPWMRGMVLMP